MKSSFFLWVFPLFLSGFASPWLGAVTVPITTEGKAVCSIDIGESATEPERHAASELASFIHQISGATIPIKKGRTSDGDNTSAIIIGTPGTNSRVESLCKKNLIKLSESHPGHDGFIVKTLSAGSRKTLVIGSAVPRGCLYGVYHLLEEALDVGFFWDDVRVPPRPDIAFTDLDIVERPHFPEREYVQACIYSYSTMFWGVEEWKKELDWAARRKFNLLQMTFHRAVPLFNAMKSIGVEMDAPTPWDLHEDRLAREINHYARRLGFRVIHTLFDGQVPMSFREQYPDAKYIEVSWLGLPPRLYISPTDPIFPTIGAKFVSEHAKICGTDHLYNIDPYPEVDPGDSEEEKRAVKVGFAESIVRAIKAADPKGKWIISGWAFTYDKMWAPPDVEAFLAAVPDDMFVVNDIWAEKNPIYKKFNYFHGKRWGFSVLHSMGGWTTLHGDLADLIKRVQDVKADPAARRCTNFYLNPEIIHHNDVYIDLATELSWRPDRVRLDDYLDRYLVRRYGRESAPEMRQAWDELLASVYGNYDFTAPAYQDRLTLDVPTSYSTLRGGYIPHLRKALQVALTEEKRLAENPFYQRDIVDITRQYVGEVYNQETLELIAAFKESKKDAFERQISILRTCLQGLEDILSSHEEFHLETELQRARELPRFESITFPMAAGMKDNGQVIRLRHSALGGLNDYPTLLDYQRKDLYELVKHYYRPRFEIYVDYLRTKMKDKKPFDFEEIDREYRKLAERFVTTSSPALDVKNMKYAGKPGSAARAVLAQISGALTNEGQ